MDLLVRPAVVGDLEALADIYLSSARHHAGLDPELYRIPDRGPVLERLRRLIEGRGESSEYIAAVVTGVAVGSASIRLLGSPSPGSMVADVPTAEIGVAVESSWRGRGIGSMLMDAAETWARDSGARRVVLDVSSANDGALRFYRRRGYREYGLLLRRSTAEGGSP